MYKVKLTRLIIKKLYGLYEYDIEFNNDITFLYGLNGCGKTTVLNITQSIITGNLFELLDYNFNEIQLFYNSKEEESDSIIVTKNNNELDVCFEGEKYIIEENRQISKDSTNTSEEYIKKHNFYFENYEFLRYINRMFNYVYLPLNRTVNSDSFYVDDFRYYNRVYHRQRYFSEMKNVPSNKRDKALMDVEMLIYETINKANLEITSINDSFRNNILKSSLDIGANSDIKQIHQQISYYTKEKIQEIEQSYIRLLSDLDILSSEEKRTFTKFFKKLITLMEKKDTGKPEDIANLILDFIELNRIEKFTHIASSAESQKNKVRENIQLFEKTINEFIQNGENDKKIVITDEGEIGFRTNFSDDLISVQYLSSGERQLLIFFANLIFKVGKSSSGIFVVDEPELSLHLSWQKIFVETAIKINPNIQMIFATHSPEFIGKNRNRMVKLDKKLS